MSVHDLRYDSVWNNVELKVSVWHCSKLKSLCVLFDCASWFFLHGWRRINEVKIEGQINLLSSVITTAQWSVTSQPEVTLVYCDVFLLVSKCANTQIYLPHQPSVQIHQSMWVTDSHHSVCLCVLVWIWGQVWMINLIALSLYVCYVHKHKLGFIKEENRHRFHFLMNMQCFVCTKQLPKTHYIFIL